MYLHTLKIIFSPYPDLHPQRCQSAKKHFYLCQLIPCHFLQHEETKYSVYSVMFAFCEKSHCGHQYMSSK